MNGKTTVEPKRNWKETNFEQFFDTLPTVLRLVPCVRFFLVMAAALTLASVVFFVAGAVIPGIVFGLGSNVSLWMAHLCGFVILKYLRSG